MESEIGGWPDASKLGVPLNPERDGWHWLGGTCHFWRHETRRWYCFGKDMTIEMMARWSIDRGRPYEAPVLTPAEVAAAVEKARAEGRLEGATLGAEEAAELVAAAVAGERERCAGIAEERDEDGDVWPDGHDIAAAIRRGDEGAT